MSWGVIEFQVKNESKFYQPTMNAEKCHRITPFLLGQRNWNFCVRLYPGRAHLWQTTKSDYVISYITEGQSSLVQSKQELIFIINVKIYLLKKKMHSLSLSSSSLNDGKSKIFCSAVLSIQTELGIALINMVTAQW